MASSNKLPFPVSDAFVMISKDAFTSSSFLLARNSFSRLIWASLTAVLSTSKVYNGSSFSRRNLFTPTIVSLCESIRACLRAAASSILIFGTPVSMALAIPPSS